MGRRAAFGAMGSVALVAALVGWSAVPAGATVFSNTGAITIPVVGNSAPYPSTISVPASGPITDVNMTVTGLSHTYPHDVDMLLVGPTGASVVPMADAGPDVIGHSIAGVNLTFDDAASATIPATSTIVTGTYKPTAGIFNGGAPAPAGPYGSALSVFNGTNANGTWSLFVYDDTGADSGSISGGWSLDITTLKIASFSPTAARVGAQVVLTGSGFTGATAVKFGSIPAVTFTVDSDTQITATVPAGAGTGSISVTAPVGTATSPTAFVVQHARHVSLTLSGKKGKGTVDAVDGFTSCTSNVPVKVQHLDNHKWHTVAGVLTQGDGSYKAVGLTDPGKYRTVAKKTTLASGDVCQQAISPVAKK